MNINARAYWELCKPRVVMLMLLTAVVGMQLAVPIGDLSWHVLIFGTIGIGLISSAAAAVNHLVDRDIDGIMGRTRRRPLPTQKVTPRQAIIFAFLLGSLGMLTLTFFVNSLTALLTVLTFIGYAGIYTLYLKHATPQNIVIGGLAGAMPPLLGWTAVTNHISAEPLLLVLIIFLWTPPHFWALAIHRREDYKEADVPMLPNTHGVAFTKLTLTLYTFLMFASTLMPYAIGMSGLIYLSGALVLGAGFFYHVWLMCTDKHPHAAMNTFWYSIFYLLMLFVFLLLDHYLPIGLFT